MNCKHCTRYCEERRRIGWSFGFCSPVCEKKYLDAASAAFAAWWERDRSVGTKAVLQ